MIYRFSKVYVYPEAIDMRSSFEKLSHFIVDKLKRNLNEGDLFLFLGKNRKRLKILFFDRFGLLLVIKRTEKNQFMSITELKEKKELTQAELKLILHGSVLRKFYPDRAA